MTAHPATGESLLQLMHQQPERCPLFRCPCVRRASPAVQAAFVANSDTLRIKTFRMCPDPFHRTGKMRCSILADIIMITCPVKSPPTVHRIQIKSRQLLCLPALQNSESQLNESFLIKPLILTINPSYIDYQLSTLHFLHCRVRSFLVASAAFVSTATGVVVLS